MFPGVFQRSNQQGLFPFGFSQGSGLEKEKTKGEAEEVDQNTVRIIEDAR